jgi:hypothetical protein
MTQIFSLGFLVATLASNAWTQEPLPRIAGANWFEHPQQLCAALESRGIKVGNWRAANALDAAYLPVHPYLCRSQPLNIPADATEHRPPIESTIEVSGDIPVEADRVSIVIASDQRDRAVYAEAKNQMMALIRAGFDSIGQPVPAALAGFVQKDLHYVSHQRYGTLSFVEGSNGGLSFHLGKIP